MGGRRSGLEKFAVCVVVVILSFAMPFYVGNTFALLAILGAMGACLLVAKFTSRDPAKRNFENRREVSDEGTRDAPTILIMAVPVVVSVATIVAIIWASGAGI